MATFDGDDGKIVRFPPGQGGRPYFYAVLAGVLVLCVWFVLGGPFYTVEQDEKAVVLTFGMYHETTGPGLHFKIPWPVQTIVKEKVTHVRRIEVGFRTHGTHGQPGGAAVRDFKRDPEMLEEAQMLTGDENIVNVEIVVQFEISSLQNWLFGARHPETILRMVAESSLRHVVGDNGIDDVLIHKRSEIAIDIRQRIKDLAERYGLGVNVITVQLQEALPPDEVSASFKEVATAKEESAKLQSQAAGYANEKKHLAGGQAARVKAQAEGYAAERVALARGEAERFQKLAAEYTKNPEIMRERLYLETLQRILPKARKVIVDPQVGILNLNRLGEPAAAGTPPGPVDTAPAAAAVGAAEGGGR
jgi:membrane protease subunit HflK